MSLYLAMVVMRDHRHFHVKSSDAVTTMANAKAKSSKTPGKAHPRKVPAAKHVDLYRQLATFNEACAEASRLMQCLAAAKTLSRSEFAQYGAMLEELRAAVSQGAADYLGRVEISANARAEKLRLKLERKLLG